MKVKLFKKVRKRFEINYYLNGYDFGGGFEINLVCIIVLDKKLWIWNFVKFRINEIYWIFKEDLYDKCYEYLIDFILNVYDKYGIC